MQRTIRLKLTLSLAQAAALAETSRLFTAAFNRFVELGWDAGVSNATKLHYLAYYPVWSTKPRNGVVRWLRLTRDIPLRRFGVRVEAQAAGF